MVSYLGILDAYCLEDDSNLPLDLAEAYPAETSNEIKCCKGIGEIDRRKRHENEWRTIGRCGGPGGPFGIGLGPF